MFERYTEKARRVVFFSRDEASQGNSQEILPCHLVLAILREDGALLHALGLKKEDKNELQRAILPPAEPGHKVSVSVDLPLSRAAKRVLAYAAEECEQSGNKDIRPAHILLGVLREDETATETLKRHGVSAEKVRALVQTARSASQPQHLGIIRELSDQFRKVEAPLSSDVEPAPVYLLSPAGNTRP